MKAQYDRATDTLTLRLNVGRVAESDETKPGVIIDYDEDGNIVGLEILNASQRVADPQLVEFSVSF